MRALFDPDLDAAVDEADVAEFRRGLAALSHDHRKVLAILIPKLVALQERGDSAGSLRLIAEIQRVVGSRSRPVH